eukprot:CAMPEP_0184679072 /NCGR_PEP_ID=MMETSP0312-20130426/1911_1 /TAXON_ID=31354 /ORGANISM="Compsopogon coeruleus, Strain SAG 36.94" /LENGTH=164 /DNA_ID=CAMNT_0027128295 /DNA_START=1122 /DNA_END=1613 /DNA_ORIENTATION=+
MAVESLLAFSQTKPGFLSLQHVSMECLHAANHRLPSHNEHDTDLLFVSNFSFEIESDIEAASHVTPLRRHRSHPPPIHNSTAIWETWVASLLPCNTWIVQSVGHDLTLSKQAGSKRRKVISSPMDGGNCSATSSSSGARVCGWGEGIAWSMEEYQWEGGGIDDE